MGVEDLDTGAVLQLPTWKLYSLSVLLCVTPLSTMPSM